MRIAIVATAVGLSVVGLSMADNARATMRMHMDIPAQGLDRALKAFAQARDLQVLYFSGVVKDLRTSGVSGELTADEALTQLLSGTGLTYRYVDERAVTIVPEGVSGTGEGKVGEEKSKEGDRKKSSWGESRDGQVEVAQGQDAGSNAPARQNSDDSLNEKGQGDQLQEIVVTAQKRAEKLQDVPISITVLTGQYLDRSTEQGVADALNRVPGVATQPVYLSGGTLVVVRGVAPSFPGFSGSSPVAYYLDSVPFGQVKSAFGPDQNAYDLDRVEVLRGPQGTLYGANALNGVVRVLTHDADLSSFDFKARVLDSYTQYGGDNYRGDVAVNVPIVQDKLAVRAVAGYDYESGWIDQPIKKNANDGELRNYRLKVNARPTDALSIGLSAWSARDNFGAPPIGYDFDKQASLLNQFTITNYDAYGLKVGYQFSKVSVTSSTSYLDFFNAGNIGLDAPPAGIPGSIFFNHFNSQVFAEEVNLNSVQKQGDKWRWSAGGIYRRASDAAHQGFTVIDSFDAILDTSKSYAVFGELTRLFLDGKLELTAGVRHFRDDLSESSQQGSDPATDPFVFGDSISTANTPRGVLTWHPSERQMVYASYAQGFRSGFTQVSGVPLGFPAAQPDRLRNYELGTKGSFSGGRVAYEASIYYMYWQGVQQRINAPPLNFIAVINGQSASGVGADLGISIEPVRNLVVGANASWNNLEMDADVFSKGGILFHKGDRLTSSPETTVGTSLDYTLPLSSAGYKGKLSVSANYTSEQSYRNVIRIGTPAVVQDGDPMFFARAGFEIIAPEHWTAMIYGDNLNNERGSPARQIIGAENWAVHVRPRTMGVQFSYSFK